MIVSFEVDFGRQRVVSKEWYHSFEFNPDEVILRHIEQTYAEYFAQCQADRRKVPQADATVEVVFLPGGRFLSPWTLALELLQTLGNVLAHRLPLRHAHLGILNNPKVMNLRATEQNPANMICRVVAVQRRVCRRTNRGLQAQHPLSITTRWTKNHHPCRNRLVRPRSLSA